MATVKVNAQERAVKITTDGPTVVASVKTTVVKTGGTGPQGATGATGAAGQTGTAGAKGDTGAQGPQGNSGVVGVTAPITNSGTSSNANIGITTGTGGVALQSSLDTHTTGSTSVHGIPDTSKLLSTGVNGYANARFCGYSGSFNAPTSGTWQVGDVVVGSGSRFFICATAGTPGTWAQYVPLSANGSTTPSSVTATSTNTIGSNAYGARIDHTHALDLSGVTGTATPLVDGAPSAGSGTRFSLENHVHPTDTSRAPKASPVFTGVPTTPTAAPNTNTLQVASTEFVLAQGAPTTATPIVDGTPAVGTSTQFARADHVHPTDTTRAASVHTHTVSQITDAGTAAAKNIAATGDAASTEVVTGSDTRLTNARTPTAHTHTLSQVTDAGTAASKTVPATGDASSTQVVLGSDTRLTNTRTPSDLSVTDSTITSTGLSPSKITGTAVITTDTRLSDSRTPTAHKSTHATGAADAIAPSDIGAQPASVNLTTAAAAGTASVRALGTGATDAAAGNDSRLSDARTPTAHTHNATDINAGTLGIARIPTGNTSSTVTIGNDSRLSDARTPTSHASSHGILGADAVSIDATYQLTSGTVPLARLSGITIGQLSLGTVTNSGNNLSTTSGSVWGNKILDTGSQWSITQYTATGAIGSYDGIHLATTSGITLTLSSALAGGGIQPGRTLIIKNNASSSITVKTASGEYINGTNYSVTGFTLATNTALRLAVFINNIAAANNWITI